MASKGDQPEDDHAVALNGDEDGESAGRIQETAMILRCECGVIISAIGKQRLIKFAREHYAGAHPDLGSDIAAHMILAMAEEEVRT